MKLTLLCLLDLVVNVSSIPWLKNKKGEGESLTNIAIQPLGLFSLLDTKALFFLTESSLPSSETYMASSSVLLGNNLGPYHSQERDTYSPSHLLP